MIGSISLAISLLLLQLSTPATAQSSCGCANTTAVCGFGNTCMNNTCQPLVRPTLPAGVADGTPACLRGAGECCGNGRVCAKGQVCEMNECQDATACPKPAQPCDKMPCADDEYCVNDSNSATAFRCEKAAPCGCADPAAKCGTGKTCKSNKCQPMPRVMLPVGVLDGTPGCVRSGGECCGAGWTCASGEVCENDKCIDVSTCPAPQTTCASKPCAVGERCIDEPKQCITTPCPQFRCEKIDTSACAANPCAPDQVCFEDPKQCITTPCPQYRCEGAKMCGCVAPTVKCDRGMTCKDNKCQPMPTVTLPAGVADGTPACLRGAGDCCGSGSFCSSDQVCESNKCVAASSCPTPGKCYTCKTSGIKSYSDGCNQCTCNSDGSASCTERACIALAHDPKQCVGQCDGFLTEDDGACGRCTCINGAKTACSKAGTKECTASDGGRLDREDDKTAGTSSTVSVAIAAVVAVVAVVLL